METKIKEFNNKSIQIGIDVIIKDKNEHFLMIDSIMFDLHYFLLKKKEWVHDVFMLNFEKNKEV